ncbi:hypothetical protein BS78_08G013300 [Paspalum vaginatum]|nr:hypothetical protein BS78_08G013300 [Paspalum vaginatum]
MPPSAIGSGGSQRLPNLPAGFRFHPTDEELIVHYLMNQAASAPCPVPIIAEVNIYQCNPWDLPAKAVFGENEWYFFSPRDRKYPNGARPNRAAGSGYWKATGTDKAILSAPTSEHVGVKKALVFYSGKPPRGAKTDWIMHEYRLTAATASSTAGGRSSTTSSKPRSMRLDDWVLCRIYKKSNDFQQLSDQEQDGSTVEEDTLTTTTTTTTNTTAALASSSSPKPPSSEKPFDHDQFRQTAMAMMTKSCSLTDLLNTIDCAALSQMLLDAPAAGPDGPEPPHQQSPLIYYPATAAAHQTHQSLNYNNSFNINSHVSNFPFVDASFSDHNNNGLLKRKRTTAAMGGAAAESFDDGSNSNSFSNKKLKLLLPSDSRSGSGHCFAAGGTSSSSYYYNQQQLVADTTTSSGGVFQYGSSSSSNPFLNHQMLLSSHLEMQ